MPLTETQASEIRDCGHGLAMEIAAVLRLANKRLREENERLRAALQSSNEIMGTSLHFLDFSKGEYLSQQEVMAQIHDNRTLLSTAAQQDPTS